MNGHHHFGAFLLLGALILFGCSDTENGSLEHMDAVVKTESSINEDILNEPNNPQLYIDRAHVHITSGDFTSAFNDVRRAIEIDSTEANHFYELGALYYKVGRVGEAKFSLERAIRLDAKHTRAMLEMAEVYFVLTNHDRAMRLINDALRIDNQLEKAYFLKGLIYKEQGNSTLSKSSLQTVTELDPENVEAYNLLGMICAEEGDSLALEYYDTALSIDSTSREVLYNRAYYFQDRINPEKALIAYDDLLRHHPGTAVAYYNQGYIYNGLMSNPEAGVNSFTEAIRLNPRYYQAYTSRGVCLEELGRRDQAISDFEAALDIEPNFDPAIKGLNRLY